MGSSGGTSTVTGVDETYNAGMLALSEEQQDWARQYMNWAWGGEYQTTEGHYEMQGGTAPEVTKVNVGDSTTGDIWLWEAGDKRFQTEEEANEYAQSNPVGATKVWVEGSTEWVPGDNAGNSYMDYQQALLDANQRMLTPQTDLTLEQIAAQRQLLPQQTGLTEKQIASQSEMLDLKMPVAREFYNQSLQGIDVSDEIAKARTDVELASKSAAGEWRREAGRMGIDPTSGRYASQRGADLREKAKNLSGASTSARRYAQGINYDRLSNAMGTSL